MRKKEIHARIKTVTGGNEIARFTFVDSLPDVGASVNGTNYHYGKATMCDLVTYQSTRDADIIDKYDFYLVPIYDNEDHYAGRACMCVNHVMANPINAKVFQTMIDLARKYDSFDAFLVDAVKSPVWEKEDVSPVNRKEWLKNVYVAANRTIRDIIKETGLSQAKFGEYFGIPKRSIENWCNGYTTVLPYLLIMMQECLGMVDRG